MRIFGGIAAGIRRPPIVLDSSRITPRQRGEIERLANSSGVHAAASASPRPDEMSYHLTIEDGASVREARQSDSTMTPEFAKLVEFLTRSS